MKVTWELDSEKDGRHEIMAYAQCSDMRLALAAFDNRLRGTQKYCEDGAKAAAADHWRTIFHEILDDFKIDLTD